ncbi:anaerobic ribonucleoside-triphosphate reductase activating protein [archaeon]|nr:anaerobic ribonucleoside-triphosphate reductase activating protein [archaeon]
MRVYLGKFVPLSPGTYLGHMAFVIYFGGCNWRCSYCNVPEYLDKARCDEMLTSDLLTEIIHAREFIDAVVFTGGEPTIQGKALLSLCELVKGEGLSVKLQTNGSMPGVIEELLMRNLVDLVSLDIKALFDNYSSVAGEFSNAENVMESIEVIRKHHASWQAVVPVIKGINELDVPGIVKQAGAPLTVLQAFESDGVDPKFSGLSPSREELIAIAKRCSGKLHIKTKLYGEEAL